MKVGVLGTGDVGRVLASAFVTLGHEVMMGARDAANAKANAWARETGARASAGAFGDAVRHGEVVVLATLGAATEQIVSGVGPQAFAGRLVLDATNPLDFSGGAPPKLFVGLTDSLGERIQRLIPSAHVVKAFNTVGNALMFRPQLPGGPPDMFICGNDEGAKKRAAEILRDFGWGAADIGGIEGSRHLEPMCLVWVLYGFRNGTWTHAFKLLRG